MTPDEQGSISTLSNFFCGMHVVVGMADTVSSVLLRWESAHFDKSVGAAVFCAFVKKTESGVVRLVRTACKVLCKHGSEQSGVYQVKNQMVSRETPLPPLGAISSTYYFMMLECSTIYQILLNPFSKMFGKLQTSCLELFTVTYKYLNSLLAAEHWVL